MSDSFAVSVQNIFKRYHLYNRPQDRLKQSLLGRLGRNYAREFWALRDISFDLRHGESLGVVGLNGSGKSTLLQIVAGTLQPTSGNMQIRGRVAALLELGSGFNPEFTGRENVFLNGTILGVPESEMRERFENIASFAQIGDFMDQPVKVYSSGMQVRLAFSVAISVDPEILIIDEALAVGDMAFQHKCFHKLEEIIRRGTTMLFVSHDMHMVRNYCSKALYLRKGEIAALGDSETVTEAYLKDVVAEQQSNAGATISWKVDRGLGAGGFGSKAGEIISAEMISPNGLASVPACKYGDVIGLKVKARVTPQIQNPNLVCQLRDVRGYIISGIGSARLGIDFTRPGREAEVIGAIFWWPILLSPGPYSFTVSLNDFTSPSVNIIVDRVFGISPFTVLESGQLFHGSVDLKVRCEKDNQL